MLRSVILSPAREDAWEAVVRRVCSYSSHTDLAG
jgi:hypothetical protein